MGTGRTPKNLLVIKHGALGDIIQGLDAFASLRAGNPDAHIAVMTSPAFAGLMASMPWFDEVIGDDRAGITKLASALTIRRQLRRDWSCVIDLQCSRRTARYHRFYIKNGTRWIGTAAHCSDPLPDFTGVNNRDRMMHAVRLANGIDTSADLAWLMPDDVHATDSVSAAAFTPPSGKFVVFISGCSPHRPEKRWPTAHFAVVGRHFMNWGYDVVLVGTAADESTVHEILHDLPDAVNACGRTSLGQLTGLLAHADFVLGNDTGPIFLAAKAGTKTLVLMGAATIPDAMRPVQANAQWIHKPRIGAITPDEVLDRIHAMMR
jgi:ADP-heptose:LPS heptosyltransferase